MNPPVERAFTLAPPSSSAETTDASPAPAAHMSAVWCRSRSTASGSAPAASSARTAAGLPVREQDMSAVSPVGRAARTSAPAASNACTIGALPLSHASASGETPSSFTALTRAPAADEAGGQLEIVPVGGPVERRRAVRLRDVDVHPLRQQRPDLGAAPRGRGVDEPRSPEADTLVDAPVNAMRTAAPRRPTNVRMWPSCTRSHRRECSTCPVLSPMRLGRHAELVEHREEQVGDRRVCAG